MRTIIIDVLSNPTDVYDEVVIRQGENLATTFRIKLSDDLLGYTHRVVFKLNDDLSVTTDELTAVDGYVECKVNDVLTNTAGALRMQLIAFNETILVKSVVFVFRVSPSLIETVPTP